jgi:hypothetical protein
VTAGRKTPTNSTTGATSGSPDTLVYAAVSMAEKSESKYSNYKQYEANDQEWPDQICGPRRPTIFYSVAQVIDRDGDK